MQSRIKGYCAILLICIFYWILDSVWSFFSFEYNLKKLIFTEPGTFLDVLLLKVSPFQVVSRLLSIALFAALGTAIVEYFIKKKSAEEALKNSENRLKEAQAIAKFGNFEHDFTEDTLWWSDETFSILGFKEADSPPLYETFIKRLPDDDKSKLNSLVYRAKKYGENQSVTYRYQIPEEDLKYIDVEAHVAFDDKGNPKGLKGTVHDITERIKAEEALRKSEEKLNFIMDSLPDMIVEVDSGMKILWANKTALHFNPDALGHTCYSAFPGNDKVCDGCSCKKAFNSGRIETGIIYQPSSKTSGESYWENIGVPLKDDDGNVTSVLEISREVTERELSRKRELNLQEKLYQSQKMESIGNLAGGIAHEFNNILGIIIGNNELIFDDLPEWGHSRECCEEIKIAGLRARDIVKQLLTFSRRDSATKKVINIQSVVNESLKLIRSSTPTNIEIKQNLTPDGIPVFGNATQINQVLINLVNNAVDAMPETGGELTLNLTRGKVDENLPSSLSPGQYVKLVVSDNGMGMDKETLNKIFEPYFTTKPIGQGTGIGLSVVHGIVEQHGGFIVADSNPGQGTTFTVYLPEHEGQYAIEDDQQAVLPTGNESILYVDDEAAIVKIGKSHLESLGYTVEETTSSVKALEMFKADPEKFDLVISDMAMPQITGDQLISEILHIRPDMPTIICTGYSSKISHREAAEIGAASFIMKPVSKAELAQTIYKVFEETRNRKTA